MLHISQWLYTYVSTICAKCFISFSRHMFASVSSECCICFHTYEAFSGVFLSVSYACFQCFSYLVCVLQVFHFGCFKSRFGVAASVSYTCFICLQTYVATVASGCFKSRSDVASLSSLFCCITFTSVSPPLLAAGWASAAPSPSFECWRSHLL
jgi:hypothetical protein